MINDNEPGKVMVVPPPRHQQTDGTIKRLYCIGGQPWVINAFNDKAHMTVAVDFLKWWYLPETQLEFAKRGGNPALKCVLEAPGFDDIKPWNRAYKYMLRRAARATSGTSRSTPRCSPHSRRPSRPSPPARRPTQGGPRVGRLRTAEDPVRGGPDQDEAPRLLRGRAAQVGARRRRVVEPLHPPALHPGDETMASTEGRFRDQRARSPGPGVARPPPGDSAPCGCAGSTTPVSSPSCCSSRCSSSSSSGTCCPRCGCSG